MGFLEKLRLLAVAFLALAYLAVFGYGIVTDRDSGWPAGIYPMFSEGRTHAPLKAYRVFGVRNEAEERLYTKDMRPLDGLRLLDGLTRMTHADQVQALSYILSINPRLSAVRLYEETWQAGGETFVGRELVAEARR